MRSTDGEGVGKKNIKRGTARAARRWEERDDPHGDTVQRAVDHNYRPRRFKKRKRCRCHALDFDKDERLQLVEILRIRFTGMNKELPRAVVALQTGRFDRVS